MTARPQESPDASTLVDLLRRRSRRQGGRPAYSFLTDGETAEVELTYAELDRQARAVGAMLQELGASGERALLLYPAGLDYVAAFFGCLYAGVVAVPAYPPRPHRPMPRIRTIVRDSQATVALTTGAILGQLERRLDQLPDLAALAWRATDRLGAEVAGGWRDPRVSGDTLAFLQYTSGSTASPKGVMVSHGNLLHNEALIRRACEHDDETPFVSWLPLYHDLGLIGNLIQSLYIGAPCTLMSPVSFLQRPARWLEAVSRARAHTSGGPNFAYDLCVRKVSAEDRASLDLSCWRVAFNGAEPVRHDTLERFARVFGPCGFRPEAFFPCYGMAETTLIVSGGGKRAAPVVESFDGGELERHRAVVKEPAEDGGQARALVGCGRALGDLEVVIADPETARALPDGEVGEIWVAGGSVCGGYWNRPEETAEAFAATLAGRGGGPYLRTGDLGFLRAGELFVTGRRKDLIIVRGQNHYPQDLEATVEKCHPALRQGGGAAFAVEVAGEERVVVVHEVAREARGVDGDEVAAAARRALAEGHELELHALVLIREASLPKTSSGKVQRHRCRLDHLAGKLKTVAEWRAAPEAAGDRSPAAMDDVEDWLAGRLGARLGVAPGAVDLDRPVLGYGLDSLAAIELLHEIETRFGVAPSFDRLYQGASVRQLAGEVRASAAVPGAADEPASAPPEEGRRVVQSPLSRGQRALWFLHRLEPDSPAYNISAAVRVRGALDVPALHRVFQLLVDRHASLRTTFVEAGGEPIARVHGARRVQFRVIDAEGWRRPELDRRLGEAARAAFDLERGPLLRVTLWSAAGGHVLLLAAHHAVTDFWSLAILVHELGAAYRVAVSPGRPAPELPPLELRYADVVREQEEMLAGERGEELWAFWRDQLEGELPVLELPTDRPRPPVQTFAGDAVGWRVGAATTGRLKRLSRERGATLFTSLLAAFQALLHRVSGQRRLVLGTPAAGRVRAAVAGVVGYFVNPLALRSECRDDPTFEAFLAASQRVVRGALEHQDLPFATLVERLHPVRDPSRSPLFQAMFALQTAPRLGGADLTAFAVGEEGARLELGGLTLEPMKLPQRIAQFDLTLSMGEVGDALTALLDYNLELFDATTMTRLARGFEVLLEAAAGDPGRRVSELPMLSRSERVQLLREWNDTARVPRQVECVHELFAARAAWEPGALAVVFKGRELTYGELERRSEALARRLRALGVGPERYVGLCCERSPELIVGLVGILKAGAAYVPLDPDAPPERLASTLRQAAVEVLVTRWSPTSPLAGSLPSGLSTIALTNGGEGAGEAVAEPAGGGVLSPAKENAACLIYTSGSSGRPKGVILEHRNLIHLIASFVDSYSPGPNDRILPVTAITSASFVGEILPVLATGGAVVLPTADQLLDFTQLIELTSRHRVSILSTVPAVVAGLNALPDQLPDLRLLLSGGEALEPSDVERLLEATAVVNGYGLTETSVCSTIYTLTPRRLAAQRAVPIGRPLSAQQAHVADRHLRLRPIGCPGEIFIGGRGVTRGYLADPARTAARFVPQPGGVGGRMYCTGDRARWRTDGTIEFLGRADRQIQLRGFRIELGEIESVLGRHPAVRQTAVTVREDEPGERRLVGYLVQERGEARKAGELLGYLRRKLPDYMVPAALISVDRLPLLPNGKVDLAALPAPEKRRPELATAYAAPVDELERVIAGVWREVLDVDRVGIHDNFFDLGGHSLLLTRAHARLKEVLERDVSLIDLFKAPTVGALAALLTPAASYAGPAERPAPAARPPGHRPPGRRPDATPEARRLDEIAIVGLAGRFPGARSVVELWRNLVRGVDAITFFTDDELAAAGIDEALIGDPNYVKAKGILGGVDLFDARFFGHSPRVAELTDPQHRVFLECAWEALENAGYDAERFAGRIGVFAGQSMNTYWLNNLYYHIDLVASVDSLEAAIGNDKDSLTTEVSYRMNLKGPSVNVQSSSSTSLTAVHYACQSLLSGECEMALAGGVSIHLPEVSGYFYHEGGTTAPDGRCRTFDAAARGFVSGHGAGVVVLKRLSAAIADGDSIRAVIKGSACNNDGSVKVSYMAPSVDGHAEVVVQAQAAAGVSADTIGYVEAHGTGTLMGDPIEVAALTQAFRLSTPERGFCAIGSLKTNIGHLDTAAGVAGLIKAVQCLEHRSIPASLHFEHPNPKIDFAASPFFVNDRLRPFARGTTPRRAGVSSLGMGGTNTHVVLEEAPPVEASAPSRPRQLLLLSAATASALETAASNLAEHLEDHPELALADVAYTLQVGRKQLPHRRMAVAADRDEAVALLGSGGALAGHAEGGRRSVVFLFSGQGTQYPNMGRELYETEPVFRREIDRCAELLEAHWRACGDAPAPETDLRRLLFPAEETASAAEVLERTAVAQPALFVVEYAQAKTWIEWGVRPRAMIGHSIGELVAACLAGVVSLEDGLRLVAARGRLMQGMDAGSMLAVSATEEELAPRLGGELALAAVNRPDACVVSGPAAAIDGLERSLAGEGVTCRRLHTSHAFHSPMMEPVLESFALELGKVELRPPQIPFVSNLTGTWIRPEEATDPRYWARHLRRTVRFADGVGELLSEPERIYLEVGPGNSLVSAVRQHPAAPAGVVAVQSLRHPREKEGDVAFLLGAAGRLWVAGVEIDGNAFYGHERRRRVALPTYPFERRRFWVEPKRPGPEAARPSPRVADWLYAPVWKRSPAKVAPAGPAPAEGASRWWLFADPGPLSEEIARRLAAAGHDVVTVAPGDAFARAGAGAYAIRPRHGDDVRTLLDELGPPHRILHLWNVGAVDRDAALGRGFYSLLGLARAFGDRPPEAAVEVLVVSDALQEVTGDENLAPVKATLLGPCRVIPREIPNLRCRSLDVAADSAADGTVDLADRILAEAAGGSPDPVVAHRGRHRWLPAFERVKLADGVQPRLRQEGVYLITGGLGGLGLAVAEHLARTVAARLVLIGRARLPERELWDRADAAVRRKIERIRALEALGAEVLALSADVADRRQIADAFASARERFGRVHGVVHAAGVAGGGLIQLKTDDVAAGVLAPKVEGTLVLDEVLGAQPLAAEPLDFLALFSSVTSILAPLGQADYAAANAFLDAFAHERTTRRGLFTVAINWDAWREVGMAADTEVPEELRGWRRESLRQGVSTEQGVAAFDLILRGPWPQVVVSRQDFQTRVGEHLETRALEELEEVTEPKAAHSRPGLSCAYVAPRSDLEKRLAAIWQELLRIDQVGVDDNFFDLGGNSLIGLKLTARIKSELSAEISPVSLFEGPTVASLAKLIGDEPAPAAPEGRDRGARRRARRSRRRRAVEPLD